MLPAFLKATHEPSASGALTCTPPTVTCKSLRGKLTLYTSPGCTAPLLPKACSTGVQSIAVACCGLFVAEQATSTNKDVATDAATFKKILLLRRARNTWTDSCRTTARSLFISSCLSIPDLRSSVPSCCATPVPTNERFRVALTVGAAPESAPAE